MPLYDFRCQSCGQITADLHQSLATTSSTIPCPHCQGLARKILSFPGSISVFREHYNPTVGAHITSHAQFRSELDRASDRATARTGTPHSYAPISHQEAREVLGVSDVGLQSTYDAEVKQGKREPKRYV